MKIEKLVDYTIHYRHETSKVSLHVSIELDSVASAAKLVETLGASVGGGWNLSGAGSAADDAPAKPAKAAKVKPADDDEEEPAKPAKPAAAKPAAAKPAAKPVDEEEEEDEPEDDEEDADDAEDDEDEAPPPPPEGGKVKITADDVKALKETKKLREVLEYLVKKGIRTKAGLLKASHALKAQVPVLGRIEDLDERVPSAIELLDPSIK